MGDRTDINWTDATWNPIRGCTKISAGCHHCYAETMAARFCGPGQPYHGLIKDGHWSGRARFIPDKLDQPIRWRRPRRIFVNSMSDLFHETLHEVDIAGIINVMVVADHHVYQVLTKRPARAVKVLRDVLPGGLPPHIWLGVTGEDQDNTDNRLVQLSRIQGNRFISCEPLLGPIDMADWLKGPDPVVQWVVAGCESGHDRRAADPEWFRSLRDCCAATGTPFFLKQMDRGTGIEKMPRLDGRLHDDNPTTPKEPPQ